MPARGAKISHTSRTAEAHSRLPQPSTAIALQGHVSLADFHTKFAQTLCAIEAKRFWGYPRGSGRVLEHWRAADSAAAKQTTTHNVARISFGNSPRSDKLTAPKGELATVGTNPRQL